MGHGSPSMAPHPMIPMISVSGAYLTGIVFTQQKHRIAEEDAPPQKANRVNLKGTPDGSRVQTGRCSPQSGHGGRDFAGFRFFSPSPRNGSRHFPGHRNISPDNRLRPHSPECFQGPGLVLSCRWPNSCRRVASAGHLSILLLLRVSVIIGRRVRGFHFALCPGSYVALPIIRSGT